MSLGKRLLSSSATRVAVATAMRAYRPILFGGALLAVDRRLLRLMKTREPVVFACWHQDLAATIGWLSRWNPRRRSHVLASASRDGGIAAAVAEALGYREAVRGSSAARGAGALLRLERLAGGARPASVVVVADGPRPPARELKPGALHLASETGHPLWLVRTSWHPERVLSRTWARFHWPLPRRGVVVCDGPIAVPAGLSREGLEALRVDVGRRLDALAARGDALAARLHAPRRARG